MSEMKCKICGSTIELESGETQAVCDNCGAAQPAPVEDKEKVYNAALALMRQANTIKEFKTTADKFNEISDYENSQALADECLKKAEQGRKDIIYTMAISNASKNAVESYKRAIEQFSLIKGYKDSGDQIILCKRKIKAVKNSEKNSASNFKLTPKQKKFIKILIPVICVVIVAAILLNSFIVPLVKYNKALSLSESNAEEAYKTFASLGDFKDSAEKAKNIYDTFSLQQKLKSAIVNESIYFGSYEQDNNEENGKEEIEWIVLEKYNNKILVISKYALDCQKYDTSYAEITWHDCTLRTWLNNDFYNSAFTDEEKAVINSSSISGEANSQYDTAYGENSNDYVFLLSLNEISKYFKTDKSRSCLPTDYARQNYIEEISADESCRWWSRTPGITQKNVVAIKTDNSINYFGLYAFDMAFVRPAMWIDISK